MTPLPAHVVEDAIRRALAEDLGRGGDLTSRLTVPAGATATGRILAREPGVVAGLPLVVAAFGHLDTAVEVKPVAADGETVSAGDVLAHVAGPAHPILAAERSALNFLGRLSGVATATRRLVDATAGTDARIVDTRKTTPGLRALEKYAVRCGGGSNHRFGLDDAVLIKDNHIAVAGGVGPAVAAARAGAGHMVKIEVEVDRVDQVQAALAAGADTLLLDNMTPAELSAAVAAVAGRAITEASGGITLDTAAAVAATGVNLISSGWITHSAPSLDVALELDTNPPANS